MTLRSFINGEGEALELEDIDELARHLVRLMPVLRLRDARFMRRITTVPCHIRRRSKLPPASSIFSPASWCTIRKI